jgi:hypothetical protein
MMGRILERLFGCAHRRLTSPRTPRDGGETYVVCLDCGKRLAYDLKTMTLGKVIE